MAFDGSEGAPINLEEASAWTRNYRQTNPNQTLAHFFGRDILNNILSQEGCIGIRMYYALNDKSEKQLILVGAAADENDMINGIIADWSHACPTICGVSNSLNS